MHGCSNHDAQVVGVLQDRAEQYRAAAAAAAAPSSSSIQCAPFRHSTNKMKSRFWLISVRPVYLLSMQDAICKCLVKCSIVHKGIVYDAIAILRAA